MEEIDYTGAKIILDEDSMLDVLKGAIENPPYDRDRLFGDIEKGLISASEIMSDPKKLEKYIIEDK